MGRKILNTSMYVAAFFLGFWLMEMYTLFTS